MFAALNTVEPPIQNLLEMDLLHAGETWVPLPRPAVVDAVKARLAVLTAHLHERQYLLGTFTPADILLPTPLLRTQPLDLPATFPLPDWTHDVTGHSYPITSDPDCPPT